MGKHLVGREARVLARGRAAAEDRRAGRLLERRRGGRMVHVRMRAQDPADFPGGEDLLDVRVARRAGVDHCEFFFSEEVGIGAGTRHHPGIRSDQPRDMAVEPFGDAGDQIVARLPALLRIAPVDLEVRRVAAPEDARALASLGPAGAVGGNLDQAHGVFEGAARLGEAREVRERLARGVDQLDLAALAARERLSRLDPEVVDRLGGVVRAFLPRGREGDEEARVEAPAAPGLRDPVAVVGERAGGNVQVLALEQLEERTRTLLHELLRARRKHRVSVRVAGEQHAGLLEALAYRGDVIGQPAARESQPLVRLRLGEAEHAARRGVACVERASGEYVRAAQERGVLRPLQHQRLEAARARAQEHQGGGRPRQHRCRRHRRRGRRGHAVRPARSLSFCALIIARIFSQSASESLSSSVK